MSRLMQLNTMHSRGLTRLSLHKIHTITTRNLSYLSYSQSINQRPNLTSSTANNSSGISNSLTCRTNSPSNNSSLFHTSKRTALTLFEKMKEVVPRERERVKKILKEHGSKDLCSVTVLQAFNGMRGVRGLVSETSNIDPEAGIRFRGLDVKEVKARLPTPHCRGLSGQYPCVEGVLWLLLTGEIPTDEEVKQLSEELTSEPRITVPKHVRKCIDNLPVHQHPLAQFATGILALQTESKFAKAYEEGVHRDKYWEFALGMIFYKVMVVYPLFFFLFVCLVLLDCCFFLGLKSRVM